MSSVTPTEGGYNYYQRTISELEDELKQEAKKNQKNRDEQVQELETNYQTSLKKKDEELETTVRDLRNHLDESMRRGQEENQNEVAKIKNETYDKFGRYQGNEADVLKQQFASAQKGWDEQHENDKKLLGDLESEYSKRMEVFNKENALKLEKVVAQERDSFNELNSKGQDDKKTAFNGYLDTIKRDYQNLVNDQVSQASHQRRETHHAVDDAKIDFERQVGRLKEVDDSQAAFQQSAHSDAIQLAVKRTSEAADENNKILRTQIKDYLENEERYKHDKADGTAKAIRDYERDAIQREKMIQGSYLNEIADQKRILSETEENYALKKNEALRDKDLHFTNAIEKQNLENHVEKKDLLSAFNQDHQQMGDRLKYEHEQAGILNEKIISTLQEQRENALKEQTKAFNETLLRNNEYHGDREKQLENELNYRKNTADIAAIPPAAEANLRKAIVTEYEKTFQVEHESNQNSMDHFKREYANRLQNETTDGVMRQNQLNQRHASEMQEERMGFLSHLHDFEFMKENTLKNKESEHSREVDSLNNSYAQALDRQRKQNDELLENTKSELHGKIQQMRLDHDFEMRMMQRESAAKQNGISRDYEKKITDQKGDFEGTVSAQKEESNKNIRDQERVHKKEVEDLVKTYEQKLTQQEFQMKERDRLMSQNHEQELDNIRRAHNSMLQRRSS